MKTLVPGNLYQLQDVNTNFGRCWFYNLDFKKLYFASPTWKGDVPLTKNDVVFCLKASPRKFLRHTFLFETNMIYCTEDAHLFLKYWQNI